MFRRTVLLGALLLTGLHSAYAETAASPPQGVVAVTSGSMGYISWIPPSQGAADFYYVYGLSGSTRYFLFETDSPYAPLSSSAFSTYAVSAWQNGVESALVEACRIDLRFNPPGVEPASCP